MDSLAQYLFSLYFSRCHQNTDNNTYEYYESSISDKFINELTKQCKTENIYGVMFESDDAFCSIQFHYSLEKDVININLSYSKKACLVSVLNELSENEFNSYLAYPKKLHIVVFGDNNTIYYEFRNRLIPLSVKKLISFLDYFPSKVTFGKELFNAIFSFYRRLNPFVNDIDGVIKQNNYFIIPLNFNELLQYHSKKDFFLNKYKLSSSININYNKRDMTASYLIIKSWNMVAPEHRNKLLQIKESPYFLSSSNSYSRSCEVFLMEYIIENLGGDYKYDGEIIRLAKDYVKMCRLAKQKIKINFRAVAALREAHDRVSESVYMKETPLVKIKKNTRFKELRKILPDEFEWIKSRKRLIKETVMQSHCVWSYADKINRDTCQIYSYVNENGERFTLEFRISRKKYILVQAQGKYNQADTSTVKEYVNQILSNGSVKTL